MYFKNRILILLLVLPASTSLWGAEPCPKVLSQKTMDRFLEASDPVMDDPVIREKRDAAQMAVLMDMMNDPDSVFLGADTVSATYWLIIEINRKLKADPAATAALKKHGWGPEFWDIYSVLVIGIHYIQVERIDSTGLPPLQNFIHKDDYNLINANFDRLMSAMEDEINEQNGY
jgi:hypothetical protein